MWEQADKCADEEDGGREKQKKKKKPYPHIKMSNPMFRHRYRRCFHWNGNDGHSVSWVVGWHLIGRFLQLALVWLPIKWYPKHCQRER